MSLASISAPTRPQSNPSAVRREPILAPRFLREQPQLEKVVAWLRQANESTHAVAETPETLVPFRDQLSRLINGLVFAEAQRRPEMVALRHAEGLALTFDYLSNQTHRRTWTFFHRYGGSCLIPLYQATSQGRMGPALQQTKQLLSEAVALSSMMPALGSDFERLLELVSPALTPQQIARDYLGIELSVMAKCMTRSGSETVDEIGALTGTSRDVDKSASANSLGTYWDIAGELSSPSSLLKLPATLQSQPMAWATVIEHWKVLTRALTEHCSRRGERGNATPSTSNDNRGTATSNGSSAPLSLSTAPTENKVVSQGTARSEEDTGKPSDSASREVASDVSNEQVSYEFLNEQAHDESDLRLPISSISGDDDSRLAQALDRQLALCRSQESSISIAVIGTASNGAARLRGGDHLPIWQYTIAAAAAKHPPEHSLPQGFSTEEGDLILVLPRLDRNPAAQWVRGLCDIDRTGEDSQPAMGINGFELCSGIAAVAVPSKSFQGKSLIESARRCLDAARRQGPGTVKSIEVF